jgi:prefoldin subunit 5
MMETNSSSLSSLQQQLEEYTHFVQTRIRPELQHAVKARKETQQEIQEYMELQQQLLTLETRQQPSENRLEPHDDDKEGEEEEDVVDLGYGLVSCRVQLEKNTNTQPSMTLLVLVGMGFHVEMNVEEALVFTKRRIEYLQQHVLWKRMEHEQKVELHLQTSLLILDQWNREVENER